MRYAIAACLVLAGCATGPEYVASQSNYDVCRLTMGGPHARNAEWEARMRGLDCQPYYPAIQAQEANRNAAMTNAIRALQPQPAPPSRMLNCTSYRVGTTVQTTCN
jgi:hypothetical protein